ncbi:MAG: phage scaffolding protein, partial [Oscillospiraceae bacterium]|nr:phage scaffolding protein [Oscillospiraceae bacterium]
MDKIVELLKRFGIELTADQTKQLKEVAEKEFVSAEDAAKTAAKVEKLTKQLAERDSDLEKLKADNKSEELTKQIAELSEKYKTATEQLAAQETDYAAEKLLSGYNFASERVK